MLNCFNGLYAWCVEFNDSNAIKIMVLISDWYKILFIEKQSFAPHDFWIMSVLNWKKQTMG